MRTVIIYEKGDTAYFIRNVKYGVEVLEGEVIKTTSLDYSHIDIKHGKDIYKIQASRVFSHKIKALEEALEINRRVEERISQYLATLKKNTSDIQSLIYQLTLTQD